MKTFLIILGGILLFILLVVVLAIVLTPWMNRWHTTDQERAADFPGDDLVKDPKLVINRGVTINTTPARIYPWLLQIGADKAGMYSYTWLERMTGCRMAKDEIIRAQWQGLKEGDLMKMCAGEFAPPPYIVARLIPEKALIFGHKEGEAWAETWQFVLVPQGDGSTRLLTRTSTTMVGGAWEVFNRIAFVMERKMLLTIKNLAETGSR